MKKYLPLYLLVLIGCASPDRVNDQVKVFLTEWSNALELKDESVQKFYDVHFVFPKVVFTAAEDLKYDFEIDRIDIVPLEDSEDLEVTVPFRIYSDGNDAEQGSIVLTITRTEKGFLIRDMTQELAVKIKEHSLRLQVNTEPSEQVLKYDTILSGIRAFTAALSTKYDSVVFFTEVNDQLLFYVVNGSWEYPYQYDRQRDSGNYKMGVVTHHNKLIVPVEYTKIYNPNGSYYGMIEVENNGLRGLFHVHGEVFIPAEFDGIYPANIPGVFAQVKKGENYGWVDNNGKVSFDPASHANIKLFQSPIESNTILTWEFRYPGTIEVLADPYADATESTGVIIYPSFIRDLGITTIANPEVMLETSEYGMGMTDTVIKFEKIESLSDRFFGLISFFMEAGADARGYHTTRNDLLVVDKSLNKVSHLEKLTSDYHGQDPCGESHPQYKTIGPGLYESGDGHGNYKYYRVTAAGTVEQLKTVRQFNFTKFAKIDEEYFNRCHYEGLNYESGGWESAKPNVVLFNGFSTEELDVMRNEIFAEYGFIFKTPKWKKHFESKSWYKPKYNNVDRFLTDTDKANVNFILEYQRLHKNLEVQRDSIQFGWAG